MTIPTLSTPPATPQRLTDTPAEFVTAMDAWLTYEAGLSAELTAWAAAVVAVVSGADFNGTSTSSVAIGTGSKAWTTQVGKLWQIGQFLIIADSAAPANYCYGQVTAYSGTTLTVNVTAVGGSGTKTAWAIGIAPNASSYATAAGAETLTNKTIALASNTVSGSLSDFNAALTGADFASLAGAETLTNKTLTSPAITDPSITGCILEDIYTITDGAAFEINPGNGSFQNVVLGANRTPKGTNFTNGESITLLVDDGSAYTLTWTDTTFGASGVAWIGSAPGGGTAPTLGTTGLTWIGLTKRNNQVYGWLAGYSA